MAEVAESLGYEDVAFLDDNSPEAIGKISEIEKFTDQYGCAFVGIGNNKFRGELLEKLQKCGYTVPILIHPTAYISKTATIGVGTIVEPKAIVNANTVVQQGCIVSVGAIVDHDVIVEKYSHINAGAICKAGSHIESGRKLEAGEVVLGYKSTRVKSANSNDTFAKEYQE